MSVVPCPPSTPIIRGVVEFDPAAFKVAFPEFATVADAALNFNFNLATLQLANSCGSLVCDANKRETLLDLLTAHITQLRNGINGLPPAGIVGRVNSATEGSVSVQADMGTVVYGQAYYLQTQFGAIYWQSTAKYRTMRYIPAPPVCADFAGIGVNDLGPYGPFNGGGSCR
jgi:DNA-binding transcriptional regulator YdaS (Cro superfamily)